MNKPDNGLSFRGITSCGFLSGFEDISYHIKQGALRFVVFVAVNEVAKGFFKGV